MTVCANTRRSLFGFRGGDWVAGLTACACATAMQRQLHADGLSRASPRSVASALAVGRLSR